MTGRDDAARMAAGIRAIEDAAAKSRLHDEIANAAPAPPSIADRPGHAERRLSLSVKCRFCQACVGSPCTRAKHKPMSAPHPSRLEAARAALPTQTAGGAR